MKITYLTTWEHPDTGKIYNPGDTEDVTPNVAEHRVRRGLASVVLVESAAVEPAETATLKKPRKRKATTDVTDPDS